MTEVVNTNSKLVIFLWNVEKNGNKMWAKRILNLTWLIMISSVYHVIKYFENKIAFFLQKKLKKIKQFSIFTILDKAA